MKRTLALLILIAATGCSTVTVQDSTGFLIKRTSWAWADTKFSGFTLSYDTNGVRTLRLSGYDQSSEDSMAGTVNAVAAGFSAGLRTYQGRDATTTTNR